MKQAEPLTVIEPSRGRAAINWRELMHYRDLFYFLIRRDVTIRYKQAVFGALWAILQPTLYMLVFSLFFGRLARIPSDGAPYPIFLYAGLLPWMLFSSSVGQSANSVVGSSNLITKVYFPRLIIPLASVGAALVDFIVASCVLFALMAWYGITPGVRLLWLPLLVAGTMMTALGIGMLVASLNVAYRDFRYVVPFMIQLWLFLTPVIYPVSLVPPRWQWLLLLNPMTGLIDAYRAAVLGGQVPLVALAVSLCLGVTAFVVGAFYFRSTERTFADVV
ncbi:MAG TPA: ABC transporter permease [Nitrospiria bacterium]|nr:ABC transporter permease [Nitrospiria bacterium]